MPTPVNRNGSRGRQTSFLGILVAAVPLLTFPHALPAAEEPETKSPIRSSRSDEQNSLEAAFERAGENRDQIEAALDATPGAERAGMEFLIRHMPERDLTSLSADFLREHVSFAYRVRGESAWGSSIPEAIFLNNVLPYSNINERRDRWRKDFFRRFQPLIRSAKTPSEAAVILNQQIYKQVDVRYSTKRPKADQSPYESIDAKLASCTGLSILLIDACRAVGVPARFVGTPLWSDRSGNHSWVEVWDAGWHFTGAAEPTGDDLDRGWFTGRASRAKRDQRRHAIFAVSYARTPILFPLLWERNQDYVYAVNVTDRYTRTGQDEVPPGHVQLFFRTTDAQTRDRCAANFRIKNAAGDVVYQGQTKDERFDANDHIAVALPKGEQFVVEVDHGTVTAQSKFTSEANQQLVSVQLESQVVDGANDEPGDADPIEALRRTLDKLPLTAGPETLPDLSDHWFNRVALTKAQAEQVQSILWSRHEAAVRHSRAAEMDAKEIRHGDKTLKFDYKIFGEKPKSGRSLYISMHGGGNTRAAVNDRQWENQKTLYEPDEGIYLCPRAPTNTWNLWHESHIDPMFARLIENLIVLEDVDPDRVYLMGYSAGGDGVYQLAPRMADRFAAAAMMAGHPNETSPLGLRNLPFTLHMGELDGAYQRNQVAADWGQQLSQLRKDDPAGYIHWVEIHTGKGHWMQRQDAFAVPWMARYTRRAYPSRIVWQQDDVTHDQFYWLELPKGVATTGLLVKATRTKQSISIEAPGLQEIHVLLSDAMLNLDLPVTIALNGREVGKRQPKRTIQMLTRSIARRGDRKMVFPARLVIRAGEDVARTSLLPPSKR